MSLFRRKPSAEQLQAWIPPVVRFAGVEQIEIDEANSSLATEFVVGENNVQPHNILHGGVSVLVAETLGSIAGNLCLDEPYAAVGQTLSASHIRAAANGARLKAVTTAVHIGKRSHVWNTDLTDEKNRLISRIILTLAIIQR
ncbi:MAG: PaaI family thioesterase [Oligoflexus sp.]